MMITPFARLPRLSFKASATASATAENPAMIPAVENPSDVMSRMISPIYKMTVMTEIIKDAAELSSLLLFRAAPRVID